MLSSFEPGEPVIFTWAEMLREKYEASQLSENVPEDPPKQKKVEEPKKEENLISIFQGEPIIDRKSTFQAFYAKVFSVNEALRFRTQLLANRKIAAATHNMFVYKVIENGVPKSDADEDGESGAGLNMTIYL